MIVDGKRIFSAFISQVSLGTTHCRLIFMIAYTSVFIDAWGKLFKKIIESCLYGDFGTVKHFVGITATTTTTTTTNSWLLKKVILTM